MKLTPRPSKFLILLLASAAFVAMGVFLVAQGKPLIGWLNIVFFGLGVAVAIVSLLPGSNHLQLDDEGLEVCSLYRRWSVRWGDVQEFFPAFISRRELVCWNYVPGYSGQRAGRVVASHLTGVEAALPDTYGMTPAALADLLNEWRIRHT
jgi:hypothetical protein